MMSDALFVIRYPGRPDLFLVREVVAGGSDSVSYTSDIHEASAFPQEVAEACLSAYPRARRGRAVGELVPAPTQRTVSCPVCSPP